MMRSMLSPFKVIKNQKGILTVDYLLAFVLIMSFTVILFSISLTLTVVEITQYATFAGARAFYASHFRTADQRALGEAKLNQVLTNPVLATFYRNGWFQIIDPVVAEYAGRGLGYEQDNTAIDLFQGARLTLKANMLDFEVPGYGGTTSSEFGTEDGFIAQIGSYLSKEPSYGECVDFNRSRWQAIKNLPTPGGVAGYDTAPTENLNLIMSDNGC